MVDALAPNTRMRTSSGWSDWKKLVRDCRADGVKQRADFDVSNSTPFKQAQFRVQTEGSTGYQYDMSGPEGL